MDRYKSKSVTLPNTTHSKLTAVAKVIAPGVSISIPQTIGKLVDEKLSNSKGSNQGVTNEQNQKA